jgi:hypothetical protein
MLVPIFGSSPTLLNPGQESVRRLILGELNGVGLEWRSVGQTDYPAKFPLREVLTLARHCAGGVVLGFSQFESSAGISKPGTIDEKQISQRLAFPTPWNQIEAGILFALSKPLLVFRENGITGGIFDNGVLDMFIQQMPTLPLRGRKRKAFREVLQKFAAEVHANYYGE